MGMEITGIPRNLQEFRGDGANVARLPQGWKDMSRNSHGDGKTVRPSTKSFSDFNEISYVDRCR